MITAAGTVVEIKAKTAARSVDGIAAMSERRIAAGTGAASMAGTGAMTVAVTAVMTVGGIVMPTVATVAAETVTRIDATALTSQRYGDDLVRCQSDLQRSLSSLSDSSACRFFQLMLPASQGRPASAAATR
ncbi:MAG: hypothetical protein ACREYA_09435 [Cupriavidus necator]